MLHRLLAAVGRCWCWNAEEQAPLCSLADQPQPTSSNRDPGQKPPREYRNPRFWLLLVIGMESMPK